MNVFSKLFRGRDALTDRTSGSAYSFFMGGSASGKRVNERTAMQMTAVYSCVKSLSETVASLPLQFSSHTMHFKCSSLIMRWTIFSEIRNLSFFRTT